jgi:hypothetical protein
VRACQLKARDREPPAHAAGANDDLFRLQPEPAFGLDSTSIEEARLAGLLVDGHPEQIDLLAQRRMCAHIAHDLARASSRG